MLFTQLFWFKQGKKYHVRKYNFMQDNILSPLCFKGVSRHRDGHLHRFWRHLPLHHRTVLSFEFFWPSLYSRDFETEIWTGI
jgi:hypothetical protein